MNIYLHSESILRDRRKPWIKRLFWSLLYHDLHMEDNQPSPVSFLSWSSHRALFNTHFITFFKIKNMFISVICYCPEILFKCRYFLRTQDAWDTESSMFCKNGQIRIINLLPGMPVKSNHSQTIILFLLRQSIFSKTMMWGLYSLTWRKNTTLLDTYLR